MKKLLSYIFVIALMGTLGSCGDALADLNKDPNNPSEVALKLMLPEVLSQTAFNEGTNPNRVAGIWMKQFFGLDAQQLAYNKYIAGPDVMNNFWSTGLYSGVLRSCNIMISQSAESPFYNAVAKIIMANELGKATSFFGDIPYSEAFKGQENLTPVYDSQESVYASIQTLLDEAIATLGTDADAGYLGGDLIYGGDAAKWIAAAYGFKARYYLQTSKRDNGNLQKALDAVSNSFTSNSDAPSFAFQSAETANWALAKFAIERPSTLGIHLDFQNMMSGDPRQAVYMTLDAEPGENPFYFDSADGELVWGRSDASVPLISYVELKFIEAEVKATIGETAEETFKDAMIASFELVGIAVDSTNEAFIDGVVSNSSVENIVTEAYKAYFGFNFHETYANWRRTGFPSLSPEEDGANGFNPSGVIPTRYLYVETEDQTNRENVNAAKDRQGGALLDAKLWVFE